MSEFKVDFGAGHLLIKQDAASAGDYTINLEVNNASPPEIANLIVQFAPEQIGSVNSVLCRTKNAYENALRIWEAESIRNKRPFPTTI